MIDILEDLRKNYFVKAVKLEFEAEGTQPQEADALNEIAKTADLDLTVKIGGCEAVRDIFDTKKLEAKTIIAPMIESPYALKKFVNAVKNIFENIDDIRLFINIETVTALKNFEDIVNSSYFKFVSGTTLGRGDLACSMGLNRENVNCKEIFDIANSISKNMKEKNKEFFIGGGVFSESLPFFKNLSYINGFETRKIVFDKNILNLKNADEGIIKAINFEIEWLKYKQKKFGIIYAQDMKRLESLEKRERSFFHT